MNISEQYKELSALLGDVEYKLNVLKKQKIEVLEKIKQLDALAGLLKGAASGQEVKSSSTNANGSNSPS